MKHLPCFFMEVKSRLWYVILSFTFTFLFLYQYQTEMVYLVGRPFFQFQQTFIFTEISEAFSSLFITCFVCTCLVVLPFLFYHMWSFLIPSSYRCERRSITLCFLLIQSLVFLECIALYTLILPTVCHFLLSFETRYSPLETTHDSPVFSSSSCLLLEISIRIESYLFLLGKISCVFFLILQLVLGVILLSKKGIIDSYDLCRHRKLFVFLALLLSACLSPPEVSSQIGLTLVFLFLYEFCLFLGFLLAEKKEP